MTNELLLVRLFLARTITLTDRFVMELFVKCDLGTARFLVDGRPWPHAALDRFGCDWDHETYDRRNAVERDFKEGKRRTYQFENYFCLDSVEPAE